MIPIHVGIDPGSNGGLVAVRGNEVIAALKMPKDHPDRIRTFLVEHSPYQVTVEKIPKWCGAGQFARKNIYGASMAVLYGNYRFCVGIVVGLGWRPPVELVPIKWQNLVGCRNIDRLESGPWKNKLKAHAQTMFPDFTAALWSADALLIARAGQLLK